MYGKLVVVYEGERLLGGAELQPQEGFAALFKAEEIREIRVSHFSPPSERCPPLAVLHTVNSAGICFKLESTAKNVDSSPLAVMHATCLRQNKTAVASIGREQIHLVAMHSRNYAQTPCFWGFNVASSLYNSSLAMLNLRCLGIVFDLDETLIVANTLRSFEDRIESLQRKINGETDPHRIASMIAEIKRYQDDKYILKQYAESDQVVDNGKVIRSESEVVLALSDNQQTIVRPLIRLQDKNIVLTRINPLIRDTSVLVRLRPAWEDLKTYLIAKGRKRFEVFVCTMAEKDYALEMWRLLDPGSNLINPREILDRIVCVKSGCKKSLFHVFQDGNCHPKMALVIDDRLKVWDEQDQQRVHVVPAFTPYFSPQAEGNNTIPVLCVARNVACNVRGGFFKEFDDGIMQRISEVAYEDDIKNLPPVPDVGSYLVSEDDLLASNGNKDSVGFDGMADAEVERRLKEAMLASSTAPNSVMNLDPRIASALQFATPSTSFAVHPPTLQGPAVPLPSKQLPQLAKLLRTPSAGSGQVETTLHSSPAREEGEVPESELDPDTRRRLLILQHGQDMREQPPNENQFPARPPGPAPLPRAHPQGWFPPEEEMTLRQLNQVPPPLELNAEALSIDNNWARKSSFLHEVQTSFPPARVHENQRLPEEELPQQDHLRLNGPLPDFRSISDEDSLVAQMSSAYKDLDLEAGQIDPSSATSAAVLLDIAFKSGTKVEFKHTLAPGTELQFFMEVFFAGQKIGEGIGRTRREAQCHAAEGSLFYLADKYLSQLNHDSSNMSVSGISLGKLQDSYINDGVSSREATPSRTSVSPRILDPRIETSKKSTNSISALKELCMMEGLSVAYQTQPQFSAHWGQQNEVYAEVEIDGQVLGKGTGLTWDEAKSKAAEKALGAVKSMFSQYPHKRQASPRSLQEMPCKRLKPESSRALHRMPSSARPPKNAPHIP
ncbi:RNA polymerase II C-terminal domain phosphatase-like 1 isoform X1 [Salvia splendens]|uniref:RNA polymerase II C-terminal domain phosphatase-like 1 isoform X1 n=1 Tax=Salvia splendens TaxID=180675 RepID=UPI001C272A7D|nr:RNA polymerase II C-terminal domain phosphatase-like 1 isoform X1 [Salvia splendens]